LLKKRDHVRAAAGKELLQGAGVQPGAPEFFVGEHAVVRIHAAQHFPRTVGVVANHLR
jgi:hypothetical protein